jgi:hypothetical protein
MSIKKQANNKQQILEKESSYTIGGNVNWFIPLLSCKGK